jgi:hypothetical protein
MVAPSVAPLVAVVLAATAGPDKPAGNSAPEVRLLRVPGGGIQPQVAARGDGAVHLVFFQGEALAGDLYYVRSLDDGASFSQPQRVNTHPASAVAIGNVRGAHIALGSGGPGEPDRVHVAWMGSSKAEPRGPEDATPMLYTRLADDGAAFEPERNVIQRRPGLDGGGSLAADHRGNVYVAWHAPDEDARDEAGRRVWIAHSSDEGKSFAEEYAATAAKTGCCSCCGMRAFADSRGALYVLYRAARQRVDRDIFLLTAARAGEPMEAKRLDGWKVPQCVMSTAAFAESPAGVLGAWETEGQVYFARVDPKTLTTGASFAPPGTSARRKHPVVAANARGETILVWTEGTGWERGGSLAWQVFEASGRPLAKASGRADGVPVWSLVAVFPRRDGGFTILY